MQDCLRPLQLIKKESEGTCKRPAHDFLKFISGGIPLVIKGVGLGWSNMMAWPTTPAIALAPAVTTTCNWRSSVPSCLQSRPVQCRCQERKRDLVSAMGLPTRVARVFSYLLTRLVADSVNVRDIPAKVTFFWMKKMMTKPLNFGQTRMLKPHTTAFQGLRLVPTPVIRGLMGCKKTCEYLLRNTKAMMTQH